VSNDTSGIDYSSHGSVMYHGPDAVACFRASVISSALRLYAKTGIKANRAYTPTNMLRAATEITGKPYKRGQYELAASDLTTWAQTMKAALPKTMNGEPVA